MLSQVKETKTLECATVQPEDETYPKYPNEIQKEILMYG